MKKGITGLLLAFMPFFTFAQEAELAIDERIDKAFQPFSEFVSSIIFFEVFEGAPFVIILLVLSALFFTL